MWPGAGLHAKRGQREVKKVEASKNAILKLVLQKHEQLLRPTYLETGKLVLEPFRARSSV